MATADLRRIDALLELRGGFLQFRQSTANIPSQLRARIEQAEGDLERRRRSIDAEIESLEEQARSDDDDARDDAQRALEEAHASRARVRAQQRKLSSAAARHVAAAAAWHRTLETTIPAATAFLAQKHTEAQDYLRAGVPAAGAPADTSSSALGGTAAKLTCPEIPETLGGALAHPATAASPQELPALPAGFSWIPIDRIDQSELPTRADFKKGVSYDTMRVGLERLWAEMLPRVDASSNRSRELLREFDEVQGRIDPMGFVHEASLAHLWDQFFDPRFTGNHIRVIFETNLDRWTVENGLHRIRVARDLGWKFVPGRVATFAGRANP